MSLPRQLPFNDYDDDDDQELDMDTLMGYGTTSRFGNGGAKNYHSSWCSLENSMSSSFNSCTPIFEEDCGDHYDERHITARWSSGSDSGFGKDVSPRRCPRPGVVSSSFHHGGVSSALGCLTPTSSNDSLEGFGEMPLKTDDDDSSSLSPMSRRLRYGGDVDDLEAPVTYSRRRSSSSSTRSGDTVFPQKLAYNNSRNQRRRSSRRSVSST